jgi:ferric-dicitrate binding protein FerR (iron transport regulator)
MNRNPIDVDELLDRALDEIRDQLPDAAAEQASAERVWERLRGEVRQATDEQRIHDCAGFQALIPALLREALQPARALLVQDHLGECVACRREFKRLRAGERRTPAPAPHASKSRLSRLGWRLAAAAVFVFGLIGLSVKTDLFVVRAGGLIRIETVEGELFRVGRDGSVRLQPGEQVRLEPGENLRTAKDSAAMIRLADESRVEIDSRSELTVHESGVAWRRGPGESVVDLQRGNIIVEAAEQGSGRLVVNTDDCRAAVTGTVFAVSHGVKGSRVSVIEGEVRVAHSGEDDVLRPGDQITTRRGLTRVPLSDEIAWSRNSERHLQVLREFTALGRELEGVLDPELRYSTELLDLAPADTAIFLAIPNVSRALGEAYQVLRQRVAASEVLSDWWDENMVAGGGDEELRRAIEKIGGLGEYLGPEIAVMFELDEGGEPRAPLVAAHVTNATSFRALLEHEAAEQDSTPGHGPEIRILEGQPPLVSAATAGRQGSEPLLVWLDGDLALLSPELERIQAFAPAASRLHARAPRTAFLERVAEQYASGVQYVLAVDLETLLRRSVDGDEHVAANERNALRDLGLMDMQHLLAQHRSHDGRTEYRATLSFSQARRGIAAWLDAPAPMGALEFVSTQPALAAGFVMREPRVLVEELFDTLGKLDDDFDSELREFESQVGIDIRRDLAAVLGGEFAFAVDGPLLPEPSWKLILEVYDPARLQQTLAWAVEQLGQLADDVLRVELETEEVGGRTYYRLRSPDSGFELDYVFAGGYLIVAPSRVLLDRAIGFRDEGINLTRAASFTSLLPQDGQVHFSAAVYQHLGPLLGPLSRTLSGMRSEVSPETQKLIDEITSMARPSLTLAYGEEDRVSVVYSHEGGFLGSGLGTLFTFRGLLNVPQLVGEAARESAGPSGEPTHGEGRSDRALTEG